MNPKSWELSPEDFKKYTPKQFADDRPLAMKMMLPKV
jgi:hypothetical protein